MDSRKFKFLKAVLGEDGARALSKAAERAPELEGALLPRTIMSWLNLAGRGSDFEGQIPGVENTYLQFSKAEERFSGSVGVGNEVYSFEAATIMHLGACMAVALGSDHERLSPELRDLDIQRLGKNIDTLVKARVVVHELRKKVLDPAAGYQITVSHQDLGDGNRMTHVHAHKNGVEVARTGFAHLGNQLKPVVTYVAPEHRRQGLASALYSHAQKATGKTVTPSEIQSPDGEALWAGNQAQKQFGKAQKNPSQNAEAPGPAHAPTAPTPPMAPTPPDPTQDSKGPTVSLRPQAPKLPTPKASTDVIQTGHGAKLPKMKTPSLKVTKAQAETECPVCAGKQFKGSDFVGCICFRDLAKSVKVEVLADGYNLEFRADWDQDSILTLLESLGRK